MIRTHTAQVDGAPLPLLVSSLIPATFAHGFTTRAGGVSPPPYDSLNLGFRWGDTRENVLENRRRVRVAAGTERLHLASQVHGARVIQVHGGADVAATAQEQADALVTDATDLAVATMVADCVPVLMADVRTGACAAAHAGWRGTVAGVLTATLDTLSRLFGARPGDLRIVLGPAIGPCCFEVGQEVADVFASTFAGAEGVVIPREGRNPHVDLRRAQRFALERAGVDPSGIDVTDACTRCEPGRFFSYRREGTKTGQHLGFVRRL
jgi:polyphenol oxidase